MISKLKYLFFLIPCFVVAQDLEQTLNDISVIVAVKNTHKRENARLEDIEENQVKIIVPTTITSKQAIELSLRQERLYNSLYKIFDVVDNLQLFLKIINESDEIYQELEDLYNISKDHPEATTIAGFSELFVLKQSVTVLGDLFRATQQSKFNLMNNVQRIKLMGRCLDNLIALKEYVQYMNTLVKSSIKMELYNDVVYNDGEIEGLDFSDILDIVKEDYIRIFPETLKDE